MFVVEAVAQPANDQPVTLIVAEGRVTPDPNDCSCRLNVAQEPVPALKVTVYLGIATTLPEIVILYAGTVRVLPERTASVTSLDKSSVISQTNIYPSASSSAVKVSSVP